RGNGLGLSIVSAIAKAHGGIVRADPGVAGGLEVVVSLPARG
ncbi:MAG TPA: two-component sensor histidine kinase, partial [Candidatus Dormibacteraeota bacterium]